MDDIAQYIEDLNSSPDTDELFARFSRIMGRHGYDRVAYSLVTDHPTLGLPRQHGLSTSYPEDWMKYYRERNYMQVDPVTRRVLASRKPFFWSEVMDDPKLETAPRALMHEAAESGVCDGIGISLCGQSGELVGVGLARTGPAAGRDYQFLAAAYLLSVYFQETYRDLLCEPLAPKMSPREQEILCWAAESKSDEDIATITGISLNTVRFHWKNIFRKLGANGRTYAVMKAIRLQVIVPTFVANPYRKR